MNKWYFPLSDNAHTKGLKDSGIETFRGQLLASLAREIVQNSLDAKREDSKSVYIEFSYFNMVSSRFPDIDGFRQNIVESIAECEHMKDESTKKFFLKAESILNQDTIPFVRISDFNTNGLRGSKSKKSSDWKNLVKSSGVSDKNAQAGGSFGIGKNAPFACSNLHTVFYSTLDIDGNEAFEGVTNLISVTKPELDDFTQGIGYYASNNRHEPIYEQANLDLSFNRVTSGTDIYITGIKFDKDYFENEVMRGLLNNFLYAIYMGTLVVSINEKTIDRTNLMSYVFANKSVLDKETIEMLELLDNPDALKFNDFRDNEATFILLEDPEGSRKISVIRKPWMKITNFDGFTRAVDFKGVFIVHGSKTNELLRKMENPQHDKWETDRLEEIERNQGDRLLKDMRRYISDQIIKLSNLGDVESLELIGADDYIKLIDDESQSKQKKIKEHVSKVGVRNNDKHKLKETVFVSGDLEMVINEIGDEDQYDVDIPSHDVIPNPSPDPNPNPIDIINRGKRVSITRNQIKVLKLDNKGRYKMFFKSNSDDISVNVEIFPVDEEGKIIADVLKIENAFCLDKKLKTTENIIQGVGVINGVISIEFTTNILTPLSLGVNIYEING